MHALLLQYNGFYEVTRTITHMKKKRTHITFWLMMNAQFFFLFFFAFLRSFALFLLKWARKLDDFFSPMNIFAQRVIASCFSRAHFQPLQCHQSDEHLGCVAFWHLFVAKWTKAMTRSNLDRAASPMRMKFICHEYHSFLWRLCGFWE